MSDDPVSDYARLVRLDIGSMLEVLGQINNQLVTPIDSGDETPRAVPAGLVEQFHVRANRLTFHMGVLREEYEARVKQKARSS